MDLFYAMDEATLFDSTYHSDRLPKSIFRLDFDQTSFFLLTSFLMGDNFFCLYDRAAARKNAEKRYNL